MTSEFQTRGLMYPSMLIVLTLSYASLFGRGWISTDECMHIAHSHPSLTLIICCVYMDGKRFFWPHIPSPDSFWLKRGLTSEWPIPAPTIYFVHCVYITGLLFFRYLHSVKLALMTKRTPTLFGRAWTEVATSTIGAHVDYSAQDLETNWFCICNPVEKKRIIDTVCWKESQ